MVGGVFQPWHLIVILVIVLIVFGPGKLPDLGQSLGRGIREFKSSVKGDDDEPVKVPPAAEPPVSNTAPSTAAAAPPPPAAPQSAPSASHATAAEPPKTTV
jgi:sec-independent protein translocase protein TatA